jgi:prepilin-type N-terminal cleavage/methylation domain-containing protein
VERQRGFTVIEVLISLAIFAAVGFTLLGVSKVFLHAVARGAPSQSSSLALETQIDALRSDAATAFAVFVPANDVFGKANAPAPGHEIDFYSKGDAGATVFWAYYYDPGAQTLRRYDYDTNGNVGQADRLSGVVVNGRSYPAVAGVTAFAARTLEANELVGSKSAYAAAVAPLLAGSAPQPLPVGYDDGAAPRPDLYGGNTTVEVQLATTRGTRTLHLASATLPSGFTVHEYPEMRAIVYRHDATDRSWFGLVQKSHVFINAQLLISYTHFTEAHPTVWCDYNLYGDPGGLVAPFGADANYQPTWFSETTAGIVYHVIHGKTNGSRCSQTPPSPGAAVDPSSFFSPPPDVQDTPPPCFYAGLCWPANAPPDFSPSPAPSMTPPASWCATHALSTLCDGPGPVPSSVPGDPAPPVATQSPRPFPSLPACVRTRSCWQGK